MAKIPFKQLVAASLILMGLELAIQPIRELITSSVPIIPGWIIGFILLGIAVYMLGVEF